MYPIIHYQVEESGGDDSALSITSSCFEVRAMVPVLMDDNLMLVPKHCQDPVNVMASAISLKICQEVATTYSVVCLSKV